MSKQTILIIEDDPTWQNILRELAEDMGCQAQVVSSYAAALRALAKHEFALVTVDVSLSPTRHNHEEGVEILRHVAKSLLDLPAIVITGYATVGLAVEVLAELKAIHLFTKADFDRQKFMQLVMAELGQGQAPTQFQRKVNSQAMQLLSERELEVLYRLSEGQSNKEIAAALVVSVNTVKKHVQSIFTKFNVNSRAAAVSYALERL